MSRTSDPQAPRSRRIRLLEPPEQARKPSPLPVVVLLLGPDQTVSPTQDALLTGLARRARLGDQAARDLLWRALGPRLEPALFHCNRLAWQSGGARRNGRPWELDDLRQEAWVVFAELVSWWSGDGSFIAYAAAYFPWRLRHATRRLGVQLRTISVDLAREPVAECWGLIDAEGDRLLETVAATLDPRDAEILRLRVEEGCELAEISSCLGISRRTIARRWKQIRAVARSVLSESD